MADFASGMGTVAGFMVLLLAVRLGSVRVCRSNSVSCSLLRRLAWPAGIVLHALNANAAINKSERRISKVAIVPTTCNNLEIGATCLIEGATIGEAEKDIRAILTEDVQLEPAESRLFSSG